MKLAEKSVTFLFAAFLCVIAVSCNDLKNTFSSGINFTEPEEVAQLNDLLNKHITEGMVVQKIKFDYSQSSSGFSNCKDGATIIYVDPEDNTKLHGIEVNLKTGEFGPDTWLEEHPSSIKREQKGVQLNEFDFSKIATVANAAVQALKDENVESNGIGTFEIDFYAGNADDYAYVFKLQHRTGRTQQGRTSHITYDEYSFKADKDGNLKAI
jgi:hypothetical protein